MRQMVLGAVIAFGLTVLVLSFLSNRSAPPPVPEPIDAGVAVKATPIFVPPVVAKVPPIGAKMMQGHPDPLEPTPGPRGNVQVPDFLHKKVVPLNRIQQAEPLGLGAQDHGIVTDSGR